MSSKSSNHDVELPETSYRDALHSRPVYGTIVRNPNRYDGGCSSTSNEAYLHEDTSEEYSISGTSLTIVAGKNSHKFFFSIYTHVMNYF